jgi:hypothetical protein
MPFVYRVGVIVDLEKNLIKTILGPYKTLLGKRSLIK